MSPGSYSANATEIYQEGLRIPPVKLFKQGVRNDEIWAMIGQNVRQPAILLGDLQSQIASLGVGASSITKLAEKYTPEILTAACRQLLDTSEAAMRDVIAAMPDGTYEFEDFLDDDGIEIDRPVRIHAKLTVRGDQLTVDLSGSSPEVHGPINATLGSTSSAINFAVIACADRPIAPNAGCYRPVEIIAPEGLIVNARHPSPVAHRISPCHVDAQCAVRRAVAGRAGSHPGRLLWRELCVLVPDRRMPMRARSWWRSRSAAAAAIRCRTAPALIHSGCTTTPASRSR